MKKIKTILVRLARARQARLDIQQLNFYASSLSGFNTDVIEAVIQQFEMEIPEPYAPRFPEVAAIMAECRKLTRKDEPLKFFCDDCQAESGMLYFDSPIRGNRLRGRALVESKNRYARRCPCGGTEHDWEAMYRDRQMNPEKYFTMEDVFNTVNARRRAQGKSPIQEMSI